MDDFWEAVLAGKGKANTPSVNVPDEWTNMSLYEIALAASNAVEPIRYDVDD